MQVVRSVDAIVKNSDSIVTVGTFDGVHAAHQEVIREVVQRSKLIQGRSVVVTFDPHPKEVVQSAKGNVHLLTTLDEKIHLIGGLHVDVLLVIDFTYEFSRKSSRQFYETYVVEKVGVQEVIVGYDHMFGRDREAGTEELVRMGKEFDFSVFAVHPVTMNGVAVSSTRIRHALEDGDVELANRFLKRPYAFSGTVMRGDRRGQTIGYPTANIDPGSMKKMIPANGVYLVEVDLDGTQAFGLMNIGVRPTVTDSRKRTIEVHILDFAKQIYGATITVRCLRRIRAERKFDSIDALKSQLEADERLSRAYLHDLQQDNPQ